MTADKDLQDFDNVAESFAALWHNLRQQGSEPRPMEVRKLLIDQVRSALDRGESSLRAASPCFIANSFSVERVVHRGEEIDVLLARQRDLGTRHAIKTLRQDHADNLPASAALLREAKIGMRLRHPHIVETQILLRQDDGRPALVFEWCETTLAAGMQQRAFSSHDMIAIMTAILTGLEEVHRQGLVHCDLSPSNLLWDGKTLDTLKISDFGLSLQAGHRHDEINIRYGGQPALSAPEQLCGDTVDFRSDLFTVGRILSLLVDNSETDRQAEKLRDFAERLSRPDPRERPESAKAALLMLGGL